MNEKFFDRLIKSKDGSMDHAGMWKSASEQAQREAANMYPPHMVNQRKEHADAAAMRIYRHLTGAEGPAFVFSL